MIFFCNEIPPKNFEIWGKSTSAGFKFSSKQSSKKLEKNIFTQKNGIWREIDAIRGGFNR